MMALDRSPSPGFAVRMFVVSWLFFGIAAAMGALLRMQFVFPIPGFPYGNVLHAHSHVAFLGWVYNAFFALALHFFIPAGKERSYWRLFLLTQLSVVGLMIAFPIQGYARESTIFSTLHMVFSVIFVVKMLRGNRAGKVARMYLWAASLFMFASCLGPLAVGPIMIFGLGDTHWHGLAIGYYLHFQYNGWFLFFLLAVLFQAMHESGLTAFEAPARRACGWLVVGCVLTFGLSALPVSPPLWVYAVAGVGGLFQIVGCAFLMQSLRGAASLFMSTQGRILQWLVGCALVLFLLKMGLQAFAAWPGLQGLATDRFTIVAFMHLIFLGVVTPMLLVWGIKLGWIRLNRLTKLGVGFLAAGAFTSQLAMAYTPISGYVQLPAWPSLFETLLVTALMIFVGVGMIAASLRSRSKQVPFAGIKEQSPPHLEVPAKRVKLAPLL